ncbi:hypothetical protein KIN20_037259 [Parelaphostrongylus tenuis]|uniref:NADH dehydrogenase [ubiquinone] flavoprotein 3, mitochondrial n=1 Tax=Parelaphostrongylus tenuis TaxID=148309 RepID=A0AAD5REB4_PARTN|nr:hypothetical protein KIN20_037259 [Parelaphostrongylus tenuis]
MLASKGDVGGVGVVPPGRIRKGKMGVQFQPASKDLNIIQHPWIVRENVRRLFEVMNRLPAICRRYVSAAPKTTTGIEHAKAMTKLGGGNPNWSQYKVDDYLKMKKYSFYDAEITMAKHRLQQPTNKAPDVMPKTKSQ